MFISISSHSASIWSNAAWSDVHYFRGTNHCFTAIGFLGCCFAIRWQYLLIRLSTIVRLPSDMCIVFVQNTGIYWLVGLEHLLFSVSTNCHPSGLMWVNNWKASLPWAYIMVIHWLVLLEEYCLIDPNTAQALLPAHEVAVPAPWIFTCVLQTFC